MEEPVVGLQGETHEKNEIKINRELSVDGPDNEVSNCHFGIPLAVAAAALANATFQFQFSTPSVLSIDMLLSFSLSSGLSATQIYS